MISLRYLLILTKQMCFPHNGIGCLRSLRTLIFHNCPKLEYFLDGIQHLTALRRLSFERCESLISLPSGMKDLNMLEILVISDCKKLTLMEGEDYPTSLRLLSINKLPQLVAFPQGLKRSASTLQLLAIYHCHNLAALPEWLPDLRSLQILEISRCTKLSSFPEGMHRLTGLKEVKIGNCPELLMGKIPRSITEHGPIISSSATGPGTYAICEKDGSTPTNHFPKDARRNEISLPTMA